MTFEVMVEKADSTLVVDFYPSEDFRTNENVTLLLDYERIPTLKKFAYSIVINDDEQLSNPHLNWSSKGR